MAFANHSCGRESINARNGHRRIHNYSARHVARSIAAFGVIDGKHVAVVGSGPAGLGAAAHLVTLGAHVDIFAHPGGSRAPNGESCQQVSGWPVLISTTTAEAVKAAGLGSQVGTEHKCGTDRIHSHLRVSHHIVICSAWGLLHCARFDQSARARAKLKAPEHRVRYDAVVLIGKARTMSLGIGCCT